MDCKDFYIKVGRSTYEFKLLRPAECPSVLLTLKGQKDKFPHTFVGFFVWGMMVRFGDD